MLRQKEEMDKKEGIVQGEATPINSSIVLACNAYTFFNPVIFSSLTAFHLLNYQLFLTFFPVVQHWTNFSKITDFLKMIPQYFFHNFPAIFKNPNVW